MNCIPTYVTNITREEEREYKGTKLWYITADTNREGQTRTQAHIILIPYEYESIKKNGYYLT